jgi:hypothetical protein
MCSCPLIRRGIVGSQQNKKGKEMREGRERGKRRGLPFGRHLKRTNLKDPLQDPTSLTTVSSVDPSCTYTQKKKNQNVLAAKIKIAQGIMGQASEKRNPKGAQE